MFRVGELGKLVGATVAVEPNHAPFSVTDVCVRPAASANPPTRANIATAVTIWCFFGESSSLLPFLFLSGWFGLPGSLGARFRARSPSQPRYRASPI